MTATWHSDRYDRPEVVRKMGPDLRRLRPILDRETFCVYETALDSHQDHQFLKKLQRYGAIEVTGTVRAEYDREGTASHWVNEYRWVGGIETAIRDYLDSLTTLPCGHHVHIHNPHDSAPDELGCKVCAEAGEHRRYPKALVRERLAEQEASE